MSAPAKNSHVTLIERIRLGLRQSRGETVILEERESPDHVLVLGVEGEVKGLLPALAHVADRAELLRESQDGLVGGITVNASLLDGQVIRGGVEFGSVAEGGKGAHLADAAGGCRRRVRGDLSAELVLSVLGRDCAGTDGTFGDCHQVL